MWKPEHRAAADRRGLRYESDLTDAEWALVGSLIPPAKRGGRPRTVNVREVLNAIFYVLWTGCQWKALPKDLPPRSTVWEYYPSPNGMRDSRRKRRVRPAIGLREKTMTSSASSRCMRGSRGKRRFGPGECRARTVALRRIETRDRSPRPGGGEGF